MSGDASTTLRWEGARADPRWVAESIPNLMGNGRDCVAESWRMLRRGRLRWTRRWLRNPLPAVGCGRVRRRSAQHPASRMDCETDLSGWLADDLDAYAGGASSPLVASAWAERRQPGLQDRPFGIGQVASIAQPRAAMRGRVVGFRKGSSSEASNTRTESHLTRPSSHQKLTVPTTFRNGLSGFVSGYIWFGDWHG
jgi:hypothetical protein